MANPKVEIRPVRRSSAYVADWVVWCRTGDCEYADTATRKTEAQSLQRKHVRSHRMRQAERRAQNRPEGQ